WRADRPLHGEVATRGGVVVGSVDDEVDRLGHPNVVLVLHLHTGDGPERAVVVEAGCLERRADIRDDDRGVVVVVDEVGVQHFTVLLLHAIDDVGAAPATRGAALVEEVGVSEGAGVHAESPASAGQRDGVLAGVTLTGPEADAWEALVSHRGHTAV